MKLLGKKSRKGYYIIIILKMCNSDTTIKKSNENITIALTKLISHNTILKDIFIFLISY